MKKIIMCAMFLFITINSFAQKKYVDPNIKNKKGLLEPGESKVTKSETVKSVTVEPEKNTVNNPVVKKYCACFNSKRLSEARKELAYNLSDKGVITRNEYYESGFEEDVKRKITLFNKYSLSIDIDIDEIECDLVETSFKRPKDYKKPLEAVDSVCKFDEIERKNI